MMFHSGFDYRTCELIRYSALFPVTCADSDGNVSVFDFVLRGSLNYRGTAARWAIKRRDNGLVWAGVGD